MHAVVYIERIYRDEPFLLTVPVALEATIQPGCQVMASLAHHKASAYIGYVWALEAAGEVPGDGEVLDLLNGGVPVLTPVMLKLALWISDYYAAKPIDCLATTLPAPLRSVVDDVVELAGFQLGSPDSRIKSTDLRRSILKALSADKRLTVRQLRKRLGRKELYAALAELERAGLLTVRKSFVETKPRTISAWRLATALPEEPEKLIARSPKKREAFELLASRPEQRFKTGEGGISRAMFSSLVALGLAEKCEIAAPARESLRFDEPQKEITALGKHQQKALDALGEALRQGRFHTFLLHGVTGSGKTLVYIELLRRVLDEGKTAIVLVPEISLTPQTAARFRHYFGDGIQIMHSAMSDREKYDAWQRLRQGKARIALGARSTIFAPLENVGAIIVDEEHDAAYKQDRTPRYHARDTAVMRAMFENALCVLGSATPSFESYRNALEGKYTLLELPERVDNARKPTIKRFLERSTTPSAKD
jgi:primosomal protein N' (replication factor Y)